MVAARLGVGLDGAVHRDRVRVVAPAGDVVALERRRDREDDVGVARHRGPVRLLHEDRVRPPERPAQAVEVLVVVERVAAGPVDDPRVRVRAPLAVEVVGLAGVQQHVRDPRDGDGRARRVDRGRQPRHAHRGDVRADVGHRAVAVAEAAARQPDLPEERGERDRRPHRLLAVLGALQRPGRGDHRPARRHAPREVAHGRRRDAGDPLGPLRGAVAERREERVGAGAAAIEEGAVVQVLGDEHVAEREHDRRVGRGAQADALRAQAGVDVVVDRAEQHDLHAAPRAVREVLADGVAGDAAGDDGQVLDREAAERHEQVGLARDDLPRRRPAPHLVRAADDVAQRDVRGAGRVGALARGGAAEQAVEATQLALRVVEAPGAGPAVGAGVDGRVAVLADDAPELGRRAVERLLPADGDPLVGAAAGVGARAVLEPPAADRGVRDARPPVAGDDVPEQGGGQRVVRVRIDADELVVADLRGVGAPVRGVRCARHVGHRVTHAPRARHRHLGGEGAPRRRRRRGGRHGPGAVHGRHARGRTRGGPARGVADRGARRRGAGGRARGRGDRPLRADARRRALRRGGRAGAAGDPLARHARRGRGRDAGPRAAIRPRRGSPGRSSRGSRRTSRRPLRRARWALQPKDWLRLTLGAPAATEPSDASATLLWDLEADGWARDDPLLPPVRPSAAVAGELRSDALGLPRGIPLVHGAADTAAALLVAGGRMLNLGTGAQLAQRVDEPLPAVDAPTCHRFRAAGDGWYALAAVQNAGLALDWARRVLGDEGEPRAGGPLFVPHLTGERTPLLDPAARGCLDGPEPRDRPGRAARARFTRASRSASAGRATRSTPRPAARTRRCASSAAARCGRGSPSSWPTRSPSRWSCSTSPTRRRWAPRGSPARPRSRRGRSGPWSRGPRRRRSWRSASPPGARSSRVSRRSACAAGRARSARARRGTSRCSPC